MVVGMEHINIDYIIRYFNENPEEREKFIKDMYRTPEEYFDEYRYKEDIAIHIANDYGII